VEEVDLSGLIPVDILIAHTILIFLRHTVCIDGDIDRLIRDFTSFSTIVNGTPPMHKARDDLLTRARICVILYYSYGGNTTLSTLSYHIGGDVSHVK
jgi:hypothetical protein